MIDVHEARVLVQWPRRDKDRDALAHLSDVESSWDESPQPRMRRGDANSHIASPIRRHTRIASPESPTPANTSTSNANLEEDLMPSGSDVGAAVQIYEDTSADEQELPKLTDAPNPEASFMTQVNDSFSSDLSDPGSDGENDPDEENDPVVHSFGPFGANLSNRFASFSTLSPKRQRIPLGAPTAVSLFGPPLEPLHSSSPSSTNTTPKAVAVAAPPVVVAPLKPEETAAISNHVINQLAFSRLSSTPLSTIMNNLPAEEKKDLAKEQLRNLIESTPCVGIITRQGKDAAGKPLESEYYYVPEEDTDEHRRLAVTDGLRKPSLRNCRKQHKQYYWKRPRTP